MSVEIADPLSLARRLDAEDPLRGFRERFVIADPRLVYLDGNSLGRLPLRTAELVRETVESGWGEDLVRGWNGGWIDLPQRLGAKVARLIGAGEDEVIFADSTSVDFFKLAMATLEARPGRKKLVTDDMNFPSDLYLLQGCARLAGEVEIVVVPSEDGVSLDPERIEAELDGGTALLALSHVTFKSGWIHDLGRLSRSAREVGALTLWDLGHSAGSIPVDLQRCGADLAVGCSYKYLNGGPGAPAFLYVRQELQESLRSPIQGWFGQRDPFDFALEYRPAPGIGRFLAGTPPVLSMVAVEPGVDLLLEAGMECIREKSLRQTELLIGLWDDRLRPLGVALNSPRDPARRGSHVSLGHPEGLRIARALVEEMALIPDFRRPDNIRLGVAALYNTFEEVVEGIERIRRVIEERIYERYPVEMNGVT